VVSKILNGLARTTILKITDTVFAAKYSVGGITSDQIVEFADNQLSEGIYSDHYLEIVTENNSYPELIKRNLELAFAEIGIEIPSVDNAIWELLHYHFNIMAFLNIDRIKQFGLLLDDMKEIELNEKTIKYYGIDCIYRVYSDSSIRCNLAMRIESQNWLKKYDKKD